jgi:hypothetical protein
MQLDEMRAKLLVVQQAKQTDSVKKYLEVLKELMDREVAAAFNLRGEEAACALAKVQGMYVALNLEQLFDGILSAHAKSQIVTTR